MIKLIVFDLDGVLVDAKEVHYKALNEALAAIDQKYVIPRDEHLTVYDGLPTNKKLALLTEKKGLPEHFYDQIWKLKQLKTADYVRSCITRDDRLCNVLAELNKKYKIYVASNAINSSVRLMLYLTGLIEHVDHYLSNEDVRFPKPHAEIYLRCMIHAGVEPKECVIVEDSFYGRMAARSSGGNLLGVENPKEITYDNIANFIKSLEDITQGTCH